MWQLKIHSMNSIQCWFFNANLVHSYWACGGPLQAGVCFFGGKCTSLHFSSSTFYWSKLSTNWFCLWWTTSTWQGNKHTIKYPNKPTKELAAAVQRFETPSNQSTPELLQAAVEIKLHSWHEITLAWNLQSPICGRNLQESTFHPSEYGPSPLIPCTCFWVTLMAKKIPHVDHPRPILAATKAGNATTWLQWVKRLMKLMNTKHCRATWCNM